MMINADTRNAPMRIQKLWPDTDWDQVWTNLVKAPITKQVEAEWYQVIHDLIPTNVRLHRINICHTDSCKICDAKDTLEHRLAKCRHSAQIWTYTKEAIAMMLRTRPDRIPDEWLTRPFFKIWPKKRSNAILWTIAQVISFSFQQRSTLTLQDYLDFLFRSRWKLMSKRKGRTWVGNYLTVLEKQCGLMTSRTDDSVINKVAMMRHGHLPIDKGTVTRRKCLNHKKSTTKQRM